MPFGCFSSLQPTSTKKRRRRFAPSPPKLSDSSFGWLELSTGGSTHTATSPAGNGNSSLDSLSPWPEPVDLGLGALRERFLLPLHHPLPQVIGVKSQRFTYVTKGEKPVTTPFLHPLLRFLKKKFPFPILGKDILLETSDGVFQNRQHELLFRFEVKLATKRLKILIRKECIGLK